MDGDIERIHQASMKILKEAGFVVNKKEIIEVIKRNGIKVDGSTVFFTEEQIMSGISKAPERFTIHARNSKYDMLVGMENTYYAPGYGCTSIIEKDGSKRNALYSDYIKFVKMVQQSDVFNINGGILVQPQDLEAGQSIPLMMYSAMVLSDKCIMGISGFEEDVAGIMDMASILFGGLDAFCSKPHLLTLINTASPLQLGNIGADTIVACTRYKQPMIISPGPMAGATGPVTIAGNLAVGNAEALATIAIAQLLCPGIPVIYGLNPTAMNMSSGAVSIGGPFSAMQMAYSARLAKAYNLPNRCGGLLTDAKYVGAQSGYESMMAIMGAVLEKTSFVLHSAGILDSYASMSFEKFISDLEVLRMVKIFTGGLDTSDNALAVDEICSRGAGGEFLTSQHTFENFRSAAWFPDTSNIEEKTEELLDGVYHA